MADRLEKARVVLRTNSILSAANACEGSWGIAALPGFVGRTHPDLVRVSMEPVTVVDFWLIVHPDLHRTGRIRKVLDHLERAIGSLD